MTNRRKSKLSRNRRGLARKGKGEGNALNTVDISDRLYTIMAELFVVSDAVAGSELDGPKVNGLRMILFRQIDEIRSLKDIIHPRTPRKTEEAAS